MATQNRTTLKTYFETGDTPTEAQFIDLIDSVYTIVDDALGALSTKNTVDTTDIENDAVETAKVADDAITYAKIQNIPTSRILGRTTAGSGSVEELTVSGVQTLLDTVTATTLASTANGDGASLIGYEDASGLTDETNVEAVINSILQTLDTYGDIVTVDQSDVILEGGQDVIVFDAGGSSSTARPLHPSNKIVIWVNHGSALPTNLGSFDIAIGGGFGVASVKTETGLTYTLVLADAGFNVDMNNASNNTVTIPTNSSVAFSVGTVISITMLGAGTTTVEGDTGVTLNGTSAGSVDINNQYSGCVIRKTATDTWIAQGDIT